MVISLALFVLNLQLFLLFRLMFGNMVFMQPPTGTVVESCVILDFCLNVHGKSHHRSGELQYFVHLPIVHHLQSRRTITIIYHDGFAYYSRTSVLFTFRTSVKHIIMRIILAVVTKLLPCESVSC